MERAEFSPCRAETQQSGISSDEDPTNFFEKKFDQKASLRLGFPGPGNTALPENPKTRGEVVEKANKTWYAKEKRGKGGRAYELE